MYIVHWIACIRGLNTFVAIILLFCFYFWVVNKQINKFNSMIPFRFFHPSVLLFCLPPSFSYIYPHFLYWVTCVLPFFFTLLLPCVYTFLLLPKEPLFLFLLSHFFFSDILLCIVSNIPTLAMVLYWFL